MSLSTLFVVALCANLGWCIPQRRQNTQCFDQLGCFHAEHGLPVPFSPDTIATVFGLHRRGDSHTYNLRSTHISDVNAWQTHFDSTKPTKFIIHGYLDSGSKAWVKTMTTELLKKGDYNVVVVDWGHGARTGYQQAAANTYVVGAEIAYLVKYLRDNRGLKLADVHIIGHSLGAQTAGHAGHALPGLGRISGLDPADPGFSGTPADRHLDATDATFVDVIHTDASKFVLVSGYGTHDAVGHIDFYPNGGEHQPGCVEHHLSGAIAGAGTGDISGATDAFVCSHSRAVTLFTESISSACQFRGHTCPTADNFESGQCLGCPADGCPVMGYDADTNTQRGTFYLSTSGSAPFCGHEYFIDIKVANRMIHTYGEFMITLVGTKGQSEALKFESAMHSYNHGDEETHVIATHADIGTVTSIKLQFVKARDLHGVLASPYVSVHSVKVVSAETNQGVTFCGHEHHFRSGHTDTITSTSGC